MKDIYIIGASGFGREVAWLIEELDDWNIVGFIDDNEKVLGTNVNGFPVVGNTEYLIEQNKNINVVIAIGNPIIRKKIYDKLSRSNMVNFPNIIAKDVRISNTNQLGIGNIICTHNVLTTNITIGNFNHINLSCTIGHDTIIEDFSTVYPGVNISGNTRIKSFVEVGTGTKIIQGKTINENIIIGAGSVVVKDLLETGTYVGIPTRRIK